VTPPPMVGRITDDTELPGGAVLLMKRAREAGGWFTWATGGSVTVEVTKKRALIKGRHADGRRFVVQYLDGSPRSAWVRRGGRHYFDRVSVADVHAFIDAAEVPSEPLTGRE
jgi:hypothetical protein